MSAPELEQYLRGMAARALAEFEAADPERPLKSMREALAGKQPQIIDEAEWAFPGGDLLLDALASTDLSTAQWRQALKSIGHAVDAAQSLVGAVVESRDHLRDPEKWTRFRDRISSGDLRPEPERSALRELDRRAIWRIVLEMPFERPLPDPLPRGGEGDR